ncbi:unnamed protein product [Urochloa humidicola]
MVTRATDVEGFPSLLNEMLWWGIFSYRSEYSIYARGRGPGLVDYFATLFIPQRLVEGEHHSYNLVAMVPLREWQFKKWLTRQWHSSAKRFQNYGCHPSNIFQSKAYNRASTCSTNPQWAPPCMKGACPS